MPSVIDICNRALSHTGTDQTIANLEEKSKEARLCARWYDHSREMLLRSFKWNFAQRRVVLADMGDPPTGWTFRYRYPADCLMLHEVYNPDYYLRGHRTFGSAEFQVASSGEGGRTVLARVADAEASYTADIDDPNLQPVDFTATLELLLASNIVMPLVADPKMMQFLADRATRAVSEAMARNLNEAHEPEPPEAEWVTANIGPAIREAWNRG